MQAIQPPSDTTRTHSRAARGSTGPLPLPVDDQAQRLEDLRTQLNQIETQLSNPDVRDANGNRLTTSGYMQWRHRTLQAKQRILDEIREIKTRSNAAKRELVALAEGVQSLLVSALRDMSDGSVDIASAQINQAMRLQDQLVEQINRL